MFTNFFNIPDCAWTVFVRTAWIGNQRYPAPCVKVGSQMISSPCVWIVTGAAHGGTTSTYLTINLKPRTA